MKNYKKIAVAVLAALAVSGTSSSAQNLILTGGTVEASSTNQEMVDSISSANDGTISSWVINDPGVDPNGYIFIYQIINKGLDPIDQVELGDYNTSVITSTGTYTNVAGLTLNGVKGSTDGNFSFFSTVGGSTPTFEGGDLSNVAPNNDSYYLVVYTDVNYYGADTGFEEDHFDASGNILSPVPEPSSWLLVFGGLACFYGLSRFRRATHRP